MRRVLTPALVLFAVFGGFSSLAAQPIAPAQAVISKITQEDLAALLTQAGLTTQTTKDEQGRTYLVSGEFFSGRIAVILPNVCDDAGCPFYTFLSIQKAPTDQTWLTSWNLRIPGLVTAALRKKEQDVLFHMTISLEGGVTRKHILQSAFAYIAIVNQRARGQDIKARPMPAANVLGPTSPGAVLDRITPEQMAEIMNRAGYASTVQAANTEKYLVAKFYPALSGKVGFDGCDGQGCNLVYYQLYFGKNHGINADWVNAWNLDKLMVTAALKDGDLGMIMWKPLFGGVTAENLEKSAQAFITIVNSAEQFQPSQQ